MSAVLTILRAGPLTSIQDTGRFGMLRHGIGASGPMDGRAFAQAGGGRGGVEFTMAGLEIRVASGHCHAGPPVGHFSYETLTATSRNTRPAARARTTPQYASPIIGLLAAPNDTWFRV